MPNCLRLIFLVSLLFFVQACQKAKSPSLPPKKPGAEVTTGSGQSAAKLGWGIQAGAFSQLERAIRLSESLNSQGLDATYFRDADGLYKVRFGDFKSRDVAQRRAGSLRSQGILDPFFLVAPESLSGAMLGDTKADSKIRKSIIKTAESYLGIPYRWGGTSASTGFDCSGLTQAVYRLNGLSIPRTSRDQFTKGRPIKKGKLKGGDLLFFAAGKGKTITHVAIYVGNGVFIHAPKAGQTIRKDSLSNSSWSRQYKGARSYL